MATSFTLSIHISLMSPDLASSTLFLLVGEVDLVVSFDVPASPVAYKERAKCLSRMPGGGMALALAEAGEVEGLLQATSECCDGKVGYLAVRSTVPEQQRRLPGALGCIDASEETLAK